MPKFIINEPLLVDRETFNLIKAVGPDNKAFMFLFSGGQDKEILRIEKDAAYIDVKGPLSNKDSFSMFLSGGTLYADIVSAIQLAEESKEVKNIVLNIESPGGTVSDVENVVNAIKACSKTVNAHIHNYAFSAAYWIASQCNSIVAMSETARVGSIGVLAEYVDRSAQDEEIGIKRKTIVSDGSPHKRMDPATDEGERQIKNTLNDTMDIFVERVATGRNVSKETVLKDFGQGGDLIARKALEVGMIDSISGVTAGKNKTNTPEIKGEEKETIMTYEELKSKLPELFSRIRGEGREEGITAERGRVTRLLGWNSSDAVSAVARTAIVEGKSQEDVLSELMKVQGATGAEAGDMQSENVGDLNGRHDGDESGDSGDVDSIVAEALTFI